MQVASFIQSKLLVDCTVRSILFCIVYVKALEDIIENIVGKALEEQCLRFTPKLDVDNYY